MPSGFPNSIDSFTNPLASSPLNSPSHAVQHQDLNDAVNKIETYMGLLKVTSQSFTGATAASPVLISSAFSSTYLNYKININITAGSINQPINFQLVANTTPANGPDYRYASTGATAAGAFSSFGNTAATAFELTYTTNNSSVGGELLVFQPNTTRRTNLFADFLYDDGGTFIYRRLGCIHNVAASYNAFRLFPTGGSVDGVVTVYGYRN